MLLKVLFLNVILKQKTSFVSLQKQLSQLPVKPNISKEVPRKKFFKYRSQPVIKTKFQTEQDYSNTYMSIVD
jgi:hypothetical protein